MYLKVDHNIVGKWLFHLQVRPHWYFNSIRFVFDRDDWNNMEGVEMEKELERLTAMKKSQHGIICMRWL